MLGSLLLLLTASAALLLLPASVGLLRAGQHAHMAPVDEAARRSRLAVAVTLVCLGSAGTTFALGGAPSVTSLVAGLLAGSVLAWSRDSRSWAVRGVVVWALLSTGAAGGVGWLAHHLLTGGLDLSRLLVASAAWLVLLVAVVRLLANARARVARRAVRDGGAPRPLALGRATPWVVTALVTGGLVVAVGALDADDGPAPVAGRSSGDHSREPRPGEGPETRPPAPARPTRSAAREGPAARAAGAGRVRNENPPATDPGPPSSEAPAVTTEPAPPPPPRSTKEARTPGYEKDKPNRPEDAPSPGRGRPKSP